MYRLFIFLLALLNFNITSQESLSNQLINTPDEQKIIIYNNYIDGLDIGSIEQIYYYSLKVLELLNNLPNNIEYARAYSNLSRVGIFLNDDKMAITNLENAYRFSSSNQALHSSICYRLATLYNKTDHKRAIKLYQESFSNAQDKQQQIDALLSETASLRLDKQLPSAIKVIEQVLEIQPTEAMAYVEWAKIYLDQNNRVEAKNMWQKALALASEDANALAQSYYGLASLSYDQKNYTQAIFYAEKAVLATNRSPNDHFSSQAKTLLAEAFLQGGFIKQAFAILQLKQEGELKVLEDNQRSISLFFRNSIEVSNLTDRNVMLTQELVTRSRLFYIALAITASLIIALFLVIQLLRTKEVETHAATSAYAILVSRSQKKRLSLQQRALLLWSNNKKFTIYRITISNTNLAARQNTLVEDYMASICQEKIEQLIPSAEIFRHYNYANIFFILVLNQATDVLIIDEILANHKTIETTWLKKDTIITMNIDKFYNNLAALQTLEAQLTTWQGNEFY